MDNQFISSNRKVAFISIPGLDTLLTIPNTKRTIAGSEKFTADGESRFSGDHPEVQNPKGVPAQILIKTVY
jgi:hypothetical protein